MLYFSHDGLQYLLAKHLATAQRNCTSLTHKHVSPHVCRHTAAMNLLQNGADSATIALWLGHESIETTSMYLHADMKQKEQALAKTVPTSVRARRYHPGDRLLGFLKSL